MSENTTVKQAEQKSIGIIGGTGQMGQWFQCFFSDNGYEVQIAGRKTELSYEDLARKCHIVMLSIPQRPAAEIAAEIGPLMNQQQLLMDICSQKEEIVSAMMASTSAQVLGAHPLFGPSATSFEGQNVIFCQGRGGGWIDRLEHEFTAAGAVVTHLVPEDHDRHMAVIQGLNHLLTICLGQTLQKLNLQPEKALPVTTPVFRVKMDLIGRLLAQDLSLFRDLIQQNRHVKTVLDTFFSCLNEGSRQIMSEQVSDGIDYMASIREFFGEYCQTGYQESNTFIDALYAGNEKSVAKE